MNEKFVQQIIAELTHQTAVAFGVLTQALSQQVDATRLAEDLRRHIAAAKSTGTLHEIGEQIAREAMAAADAESALRNSEKP